MTSPPSRTRRSHRQRGRSAERPASTRSWRGAPLIVLLLAAGLVAWSTTRDVEPASSPPAATELPVTQSDLTCPAVGTAKLPGSRAGIGVVSPPGSDESGDPSAGGVDITTIPREDSLSSDEPPKTGEWQVVTQNSDVSDTVLVSATGSLASGASAYAATVAADDAGGGQAIAACAGPGREAWFVGAGSTVDHASTVLVSNPGETQAIVDISLLAAGGEVEPVTGLVVEPRDVVPVELAEFAAGEGDVAVQVAVSQGQVAAAVLDRWTATLEPAGTEWIPAAQLPATSLTVGPLIEGAERRELVIGNPGDRTASVDIQVVGADGTFPIEDFESASVEPGGIEVVRVPDQLADQTVALRLDGDQSIVAAVRSVSPGSPSDVAYGTSLPTVSGSAVVPVDLPTVDPSGLSLFVSSADPEEDAAFSITAHAADGSSLEEDSLTVSAGSSLLWQAGRRQYLNTNVRRVAYLVVSPTDGSLLASATYASDDSSWAAMPLQDAPTVVLAPGVYSVE